MKLSTIIFLIMITLWHPSFGQSNHTKKVAILETVDKADVVPYGVKLMVRSKLAYAITNTPGYEGYDRVDVGAILGEHEFQRTGLVSDSQIKRLGEMTGADYILVPEVAPLDNNHVIIVAKILNVETAQLDKTADIQTATNVASMDDACRELAAQLLGIQRGRTIVIN